MRRAFLLIGAMFIVVLAAMPIVWKPWLSSRYAAEMLVKDDGKGLVFWIPSAAKFWGHRIYSPLSDVTNRFSNLEHGVESVTLLEIIGADTPKNVSRIYNDLLSSKSIMARMIGFYAARKHSLSFANDSKYEAEIKTVLIRQSGSNIFEASYVETQLALKIIGLARVSGMAGALGTILNSEAPSYWVAVEACRALEGVPEREAARRVLTSAIINPVFFPRVECAESLAKLSGRPAIPAIEQSIKVESDNKKKRKLRELIAQVK